MKSRSMKSSCESNGNLILTIDQIYDVANYVIEHYRLTDPQKEGVRELAKALESTCSSGWSETRRMAKQLLQEAQSHADAGNPDDAAQLLEQCWREYPYNCDKELEALNKTIKGMKGHPGAKLTKRK